MKKVILGTTFIASLLLAGGVNASAVTGVPDSKTIPIELTYEETATFEFNDDIELEESVQITKDLLTDGTVEGTILNVGGTLTNLTASTAIVTFVVEAPVGFNGIQIVSSNLDDLTAAPVETAFTPEGTDITFTINQAFAKSFAALEEGDEKPVITIRAQEGNPDNGDTLSL
ncbi:hypothetical protein [Enterococcus casseliflavus]|uniref:hypothetical protein n=1 Tax=Enterococcus casseliflavus TaxID=37734 RepID=UPI00115E4477|nr:hypothetical protein [Enterococcus casseliflavus]MDB1688524.1 hypothetical protein [Enterococcus casseliflavus]